jgi:hypothetical protein
LSSGLSSGLPSGASCRTNVISQLVCMMYNVDLARLIVDKLVSDGGLRQRATANDAASIANIRRNGWDPACGTLCCIELKWTDEEWKKICQDHNLPMETVPPILLQDSIPQDEWTVSRQVDMSVDKLGPEQIIFKLRKFILCDGNHRISGLQQLKVRSQLFLLTHPPTPSLRHHTYVRSQHRSIRIVRPAPWIFTRTTQTIGRSRRRCPSSSCCTTTPNAGTTS